MGTVRLLFNRDVADDSNTVLASNYVITGGSYPITVSAAARKSGRVVDLTTSEFITGQTYTLTVSNLVDTNGRPIKSTAVAASFVGVGIQPRVSSVAFYADTSTVDLVFNDNMTNNAALVDKTKYTVTGASTPTVDTVTRINATTVRLTLDAPLPVGTHTITVSNTGIINLSGNTVDPAHDSASLSWSGVSDHVSLTGNLQAYWPFQSNPNDIINGHNGSLENAPLIVACKIGNGYDLVKASTQSIYVPNHAAFNVQEFSYSIWFNVTSVSAVTPGTIIAKRNYDVNSHMFVYAHATSGSPGTYFALWTSNGEFDVFGVGPVVGAWNHVVLTVAGGQMNLYENGVARGPTAYTGTINSIIYDLTIGKLSGAININRLDGKVDEAMFWDRGLTVKEVADLFQGSAGIPY